MEKRGSGRTYRRVLEACLWASEGQQVCFLYCEPGELHELSRKIRDHATAATVIRNGTLFKFPEGGCIELRQLGSDFTGQRYDRIHTDELLGASWRLIEAGLENAKRTLRK